MNSLRKLSRDEGGFSLVTAILMLMIILVMSGAIIQTVLVQAHQSGGEVAGEASFNLAESALDAISFQLESTWPSTSTAAYPTCTQSTTATAGCPGSSLTSAFASQYAGVDFGSSTWNVKVIDDTGGSSYYNDSSLSSSTTAWDSNADGRLWIRADATINGKRRIVVAQMVQQTSVVSLPQNVITAGGVDTSNNGNKVIIEANDPTSHLSGHISVQCSQSSVSYGSHCLGWNASKGQFDGSYQTWTSGSSYTTLSAAQLNSLRQTAQAAGTYYTTTCPPTSVTGVVFVETASCTYTGWGNTAATAVDLVFGSGTLFFNGNVTFHGIIYMANLNGTVPSSGPCTSAQIGTNSIFTVHGGANVYGAVFVDRCGLVNAGDSAANVDYEYSDFSTFKTKVTPALAKNTFRIISNP